MPGPADEARRALQAARGRGGPDAGGDAAAGADAERPETRPGGDTAPPEPVQPEQAEGDRPTRAEADRPTQTDRFSAERGEGRPGDAARAALRRAMSAGRGAPAGDSGPAGASRTSIAAPASGAARVADAAAPDAADLDARTELTGGSTDRPGEPAEPSPAAQDAAADQRHARPADVAREALRAARGEGRQPRADGPGEGAGGVRRTRRSPAARPGLRGGTADLRARQVREALADAFRMPAGIDLPEEGSAEPDPVPAPGRPAPGRSDRAPAPAESPAPPVADLAQPPHPTPPAPTPGPGTPPSARREADPRPGGELPAPPLGPGTPPSAGRAAPQPHPGDELPVPAAPRVPRSMAAPTRDGDLRRTFPAFPPRPSADGRFAGTWWGNAWVTALEEGALDAKRLARGRGYAEQGHVDAITVTPGLVLAYVRGSRPRPYRVQVRLRTLGDEAWERFLDTAAERPGHIAALLDKEMPHSLADSGVPLLPGPGDLEPHCSCPDSGHPCKHAAALCYQTARLLDADPFVLLLLRGRGERDLLDALSRRSAARAARAAQERGPAPLPGVRATEVLTARALPPLPPPLPVPPHPEQPPVYPAAPGGPDPFALDQLATDAAARAHALLATGRDPVGELTLWQDAVRLAAARPGAGLTLATRALYSSLASAAGRTPAELARAVAAWRQGGEAGLAVLEEPWDPPAGRFDRARPLLLAADLPAFRPWRNRLTHPNGHVQLRLGRDNLWYAYESEPDRDDWWPRGTPDLDPVGALTGLGTPNEA